MACNMRDLANDSFKVKHSMVPYHISRNLNRTWCNRMFTAHLNFPPW